MSYLFSRALVEDYLLGTCLDGQLSVQLNSTPTPQAFLSLDRMMGRCRLSRYGMTLAPFTPDRGAALLTWFLAASRARRSVAHLADESSAKTSGRRCDGSWQMSLPHVSLPRTFRKEQLKRRQTTCKRWIIPSDACLFPRRTWVLTTFGEGIGYLHTPTVTANYSAPSMQKHPSARAFVRVFGKPSRSAHEWLMGWPTGWTALEPLATGRFHAWLQQHSPLSPPRLSERRTRDREARSAETPVDGVIRAMTSKAMAKEPT
jgi:hypothetical protein